jgi:hypothetical protein
MATPETPLSTSTENASGSAGKVTITEKGTDYVVLEDVILGEEGAWRHVGTFTAQTGDEAIRKAYDAEATADRLVAVPARSWKPRTVKAVPQPPKIEFED